MRLFINNTEVVTYSMVFEWDIFNPTAFLSARTPFAAPTDKVELKLDDSFTRSPLSMYKLSSDENNAVLPTYVSEQYIKNMGTLYPSYEGNLDLSKLASNIGVRVAYNGSFQNQFWRIPQLSYKSLMSHLQTYGQLSTNDGFVISMSLFGDLQVFDFKSILNPTKVMVVEGIIKSSQASLSWIEHTAGSYTINTYSSDGVSSKDFTIKEGYGKSVVDVLKVSDSSDFIERQLANDFWRNYYTSWNVVIECSTPSVPMPGTCVVSSFSKYPFICRGVRYVIESSKISNVFVTLCRPLE